MLAAGLFRAGEMVSLVLTPLFAAAVIVCAVHTLFTLIAIISILLFATNAFAGGNGKDKTVKTPRNVSSFNQAETLPSSRKSNNSNRKFSSQTQPFADGLVLEKHKKPQQGIIGILVAL